MLKTFRKGESYEDSLNLSGEYDTKSLNLSQVIEKKRILLLVDLYDWCFYNIACIIKKQLTQFTIDILTVKDFYNNIRTVLANPYNIYVFFYPTTGLEMSELQYVRNVGKYKFSSPSKIFWCMYDNFVWRIKTDYHQGRLELVRNTMAKWMDICDGYFWGSPKIRDNMYDIFKIIKPNASCMDGVDTIMFNYKEYNEDILTKKKIKNRMDWKQ